MVRIKRNLLKVSIHRSTNGKILLLDWGTARTKKLVVFSELEYVVSYNHKTYKISIDPYSTNIHSDPTNVCPPGYELMEVFKDYLEASKYRAILLDNIVEFR